MHKALSMKPDAVRMRQYRAKDPEKYCGYVREFKKRRRQMVYEHYGGKCACCDETEFAFLSMDHKNGGGTKHRLETGLRGTAIIGWIIRNNYPDDFQVLCHNCNQAMGFYGSCPHSREE